MARGFITLSTLYYYVSEHFHESLSEWCLQSRGIVSVGVCRVDISFDLLHDFSSRDLPDVLGRETFHEVESGDFTPLSVSIKIVYIKKKKYLHDKEYVQNLYFFLVFS